MSSIVTIDFHQDTIFAVERPDGVFVAAKPISDSLGLRWHGQFERLNRDPILSEGIRIIRVPSVGGEQETLCLRLDLVHGWLFTIDETRVRDEETRQKVLTYKRECYTVLYRHFSGRTRESYSLHGIPPIETEEMAMSIQDKMKMVALFIRAAGPRAGAEKLAQYGIQLTPTLEAMLRQLQFSFAIDLDNRGPTDLTEVN